MGKLCALALLALASACGGHTNTCADVAKANADCAAKLGAQPGITEAQCTAGTCTNKQAALDCVVGIQCPATGDAYNTVFAACLTKGGCN